MGQLVVATNLTWMNFCASTWFQKRLNGNEDNSTISYLYEKVISEGSSVGPKLDKILRKYMAPQTQTWGAEEVDVYFLDHSRFNDFKVELDTGGKYHQTNEWNETRDWDTGKAFARWAARDDSYELDICNADNSRSGYRYEKNP
jgi:hypothetical protein